MGSFAACSSLLVPWPSWSFTTPAWPAMQVEVSLHPAWGWLSKLQGTVLLISGTVGLHVVSNLRESSLELPTTIVSLNSEVNLLNSVKTYSWSVVSPPGPWVPTLLHSPPDCRLTFLGSSLELTSLICCCAGFDSYSVCSLLLLWGQFRMLLFPPQKQAKVRIWAFNNVS